MKNSKYYIEFVGQHTAGKTSILKHIVDQDLLKPLVAIYPQKVKRSQFHFWFSLPWLVLKNLNDLFFVSGFFLRHTKFSWINYHAAWRHLLKMVILHPYYERYNFDIWMKDDMLHLLPRIDFKKNVDVRVCLEKFFKRFESRYDGLVYVDLPYEIMQKRFLVRFDDRPKSRKKSRGPVYERSFQQTLLLKEILLDQKSIPVLVIDGTEDISDNAKKAASFIKAKVCTK